MQTLKREKNMEHAYDCKEFMVTQVEPDASKKSIIHLFGRTMRGDSVHCAVEGVLQSFWAKKPASVHNAQLNELADVWNRDIAKDYWEETKAIHHLEVHRRESLMYHGTGEEEFIQVFLNDPKALPATRKYLKGKGSEGSISLTNGGRTYELTLFEDAGLSYEDQFMRDNNIVGFGWVTLTKFEHVFHNAPSSCTWNIRVQGSECVIGHGLERNEVAPLRLFTFDIECMATTRAFPSPQIDPVIQISVQVQEWGTAGTKMILDTVLHTGETEAMDEGELHFFETEEEMLLGFKDLALESDYDVSRAYNGRTFDWPYLFDRAEVLGIDRDFSKISRLKYPLAKIKKSTFSSSARGTREYRDAEIPGRTDFDVLDIIRNEYKLKSYKLNTVSLEFLGNTKEDVHHSMISVLYQGSPADRSRLARYCRKDSLLVGLLDEKLMLLLRYIEQARVCGVTLYTLVRRGQQMKVLAQIARVARANNIVLPIKQQLTPYLPDGKYEGACVLDPVKGYHETPVACLDFSSLYPSEGIANNICYTTLVPPSQVKNYKEEDIFRGPVGHVFVRKHVREGLLPALWTKLLSARKVAKGDKAKAFQEAQAFKEAGNETAYAEKMFQYNVQDARQNALKLVANSMYGFTGVGVKSGANLSCFEISETITACGRRDLHRVIDWLKQNYPKAQIMYGDSVTGDTPVIVRINGGLPRVVCCDELVIGEWEVEGEKEVVYPDQVEIWSERGFTPVKRFIRHYTNKPIIRVTTEGGYVDVTPDHSLLLEDGTEISPMNVSLETSLMHCDLPSLMNCDLIFCAETKLTPSDAFLLGVKEDTVPDELLWAPIDIVSAFIAGWGEKPVSSKQAATGFWILRSRLGTISLGTKTKKIELLHERTEGYVYDFETENHHFHVGPGRMVVHNTDSVMVAPGFKSVPEAFEWMHQVGKQITEEVFANEAPMKLQPEKVMFPTIFMAKKRYCLSEGTIVTMASGLGVPIENISGGFEVRCKTLSGRRVTYGKTSAGGLEGEKDCIQLTLHDGRTLVCTPDHEINTPTGFIKAGELMVGSLVTMDIDPVIDVVGDDEAGFAKKCGIDEFQMETSVGRSKALAFFRLFGLLCSDGSFSGGDTVRVFVGSEMDADRVCSDVQLLFNRRLTVGNYSGLFYCSLPIQFIRMINKFSWIESGNKLDVGQPDIGFDGFPKSVIREFLGGLFGGDGSSTHILFQKSSASVGRLAIRLLCIEKTKDRLKKFMENVVKHLSLFGIQSHLRGPHSRNHALHEQKGVIVPANWESCPRYSYNVEIDQTSKFIELIGYRYCSYKSLRTSVLSSFTRYRENAVRQRGEVSSSALSMSKGTFNQKIERAVKELDSKEHILSKRYASFSNISYASRSLLEDGQLMTLEEHLQITRTQHFFADGVNKETHTKPSVTDSAPTYTMEVVDIRKVGAKKVYDLTVPENESYVANGVLVHNCTGYYETNPHKPDRVYYRGVEVVRRDNCDLVQKCLVKVSEAIFLERNIPKAVQEAKDTIQRLYLNEVCISELLLSKSLSQDVDAYKSAQPHTQLVKKMRKRDPSSAPVVGERVTYVMVGETLTDIANLAEDPIYVMENEIPINVNYYIANQLKKPLERMFVPIIGARRTAEIFSGEHTRKRVKPRTKQEEKPKKSSIMSFIKIHISCAKCKAVFDPEKNKHPTLCENCLEEHGESEQSKKRAIHDELKKEYEEQLAVCQKCQGSDRDPVLCMARDCSQLYRRKNLEFKYNKASNDIEDMIISTKKAKI